MFCRILSVTGVLLVSMLAHSIWTDRIAHAREQLSPTLPSSDARHQADIAFWQSIEDSDDHKDFKDYLEQFPDGQFVALAHRRQQAKLAAIGQFLLDRVDGNLSLALHTTMLSNDIDLMDWIKGQGADINAPIFSAGTTPMHSAAMGNALPAMEWLKAQGADINVQMSDGVTPMHAAALKDAVDAMEWLKEQRADINARDGLDQTPMHWAARGNAVNAMKWLKAEGADINARDSNGQNPMHHGKTKNSEDAVEWLANNGGQR